MVGEFASGLLTLELTEQEARILRGLAQTADEYDVAREANVEPHEAADLLAQLAEVLEEET